MKYRKILTGVFIILIIGGGVAASYFFTSLKPEPEQSNRPKPVRLVQTKMVEYSDVNTAIVVPGRLAGSRIVDLISEVQGKILPGDVPLKKGQRFDKGDLLCTIYDREQVLSLKASKSRFLNSLANALPDIKYDFPEHYHRILDFFDSIHLDEPLPALPEFNDKTLKIFLASRDILNQYYTINVAEERLMKHYIKAPFNGTFMEVMLEVGGIANPGTRIAKLIRTDILELEVPVEIEDLKWVQVGDRVEVLDEGGTRSWTGVIRRISEFVDPDTQSASVFVEVRNNPKNPVYSGMYLVARFDEKVIDHAMEIPRQAVFNQNEVFIVRDSSLVKQTINIRKVNKNTLIFNGLEEGEEIVVEPLINVKEGTIVKTNRL